MGAASWKAGDWSIRRRVAADRVIGRGVHGRRFVGGWQDAGLERGESRKPRAESRVMNGVNATECDTFGVIETDLDAEGGFGYLAALVSLSFQF